MKKENYTTQPWDCGYGTLAGDSFSKYNVPGTMYETGRPQNSVHGTWYIDSKFWKRVTAFLTALVFAWSMICPLGFAETINLEGGSVDVTVQDNTTNWNVTGNPIWNVPEFNVNQGSIYNIAGMGSGASLALLVNGGSASNIFGTMNLSNLDFILQNIAGINFGSSAMINLSNASLIASTLPLNLSMTDFLKRDYQFSGQGGFLSNEGRITGTNADLVAFVANAIENKGTIEVPMGTVALAAGDTVTVGISSDGMVTIGVDSATANELGLADQIKQSGAISAQGGRVLLTAKAIDGLFDKAINIAAGSNATAVVVADDGVIEFIATGNILNNGLVQADRGSISIEATGNIENPGTLNASKGQMEIDAEGDITTLGALKAEHLTESGASFQIGGIYSVGSSSHDNLDNAITFVTNATVTGAEDGSGADGIVNDAVNIVINAGVVLTLGSHMTFNADSDGNGTGAFLMNATATIAGGGYNLTLKASDNSTIGVIQNVGTMTLARNATDQNIVFSSSTAVDDIDVNTFKTTSSTATGVTFTKTVGSGNTENPYLIYDVSQLQAISGSLSSSYKLANTIDAASTSVWTAGAGFTPIGSSVNQFSGTLFGDGKSINNLYLHQSGGIDWQALIVTIGATGVVRDLALTNITSYGRDYVATLAVNNFGLIENCSATGAITDTLGGGSHGGLVVGNQAGGVINNSFTNVDVTGNHLGGFAMSNVGTITNSYALGNVHGYGTIGGFVGQNTGAGIIENCYATGNVSTNNYESPVGGFVGRNASGAIIRNSYATGTATGQVTTGGFVGEAASGSTIENSYSTGSAAGGTVGGFVGTNYGATFVNDWWHNTVNTQAQPAGITKAGSQSDFYSPAHAVYGGWDIFTPVWDMYTNALPTLHWKNANAGTLIARYIWTGLTDAVWSNGANWLSGSAPSENSIVFIQSGGFTPLLSGATALLAFGIDALAGLDLAGHSLNVAGFFSNLGTVSTSGGDLQITAANIKSGSVSNSYGNIDLTAGLITLTGNFVTSGGTVNLNGDVQILSDGESTITAPVVTMNGNFSKAAGSTFSISGGKIVFTATTIGHTITANGASLGDVEFDGVEGGWTTDELSAESLALKNGIVNLGGALTVTGGYEQSGGTLNANAAEFTVGAYDQTGGIFNAGSSQITCRGNFTINAPAVFNSGTSRLILDATDGDLNFNAGGYTLYDVIFQNTSDVNDRTIVLGSGSFNIGRNFYFYSIGSMRITVDAAVNNPDLVIGGDLMVWQTGGGFFDNVEGGDLGWVHGALSGEDYWHIGSAYYDSASNSWIFMDSDGGYDNSGATEIAYLISPTIDLTGSDSSTWNFRQHFSSEGGYDNISYWISTDDGVSWTQLGLPQSGGSDAWETVSFDVTPYVSGTVKIKYYFDTQDPVGNGAPYHIALDDIEITGGHPAAQGPATLNTGTGSWEVGGNVDATGMTFNQNGNLSVAGNYSQASGTYNQAADLTIAGDFVQTGGVFRDVAPASHAFSVGGSFAITDTDDSFMRYTGDGLTAETPYMIRDVYDLQAMKQDLDAFYILNGDIDASSTVNWANVVATPWWEGWNMQGSGFQPIGTDASRFTGNLNGQGHTINRLYFNGTDSRALFGVIGAGARVENLALTNVNIASAWAYAAALAALNYGTIQDVSASGILSGGGSCGGLVALNYGTIQRAWTNMVINAGHSGGLVGNNQGTISDSYATGSVSGWGMAGGLVGALSGTIINSYATGSVSGTDYVGGLVGQIASSSAIIRNSFATGVASGGSQRGGLIGYQSAVGTYSNNWWYNATNTQAQPTGVTKALSAAAFYSPAHAVYHIGNADQWNIVTPVWDTYSDAFPHLSWENFTGATANPKWTGSGGDNLWSNGANWSTNSAPTAASTPIFLSGTPTINVAANNLAGFVLMGGTVTQNAALTLSGNYVQTGGVFVDSAPLSHAFTITGSFSIPYGTNAFRRYTGAGSTQNPFVVRDLYDLQGMKSNLTSHFKLNASLDATSISGWNVGAGFDPIGNFSNAFTGSLNGFGKVISNLAMQRTGQDYVGLFGNIGIGGVVSELALEKVSAYGRDYVGGLAGLNNGTLSNVYTTGSFTVSGVNFVGGLVGGNTGSIANAYSSARVMGTDKVGGLAGSNTGTIDKTYAMGQVTGSTNTGGLVGSGSPEKVTNSFWNEKMTGQMTSAGGNAGKVVRVTEEVDEDGYAVLNAEDLADPNADMMSSSTYSGWDFGSTWVLDEGGSFPHFQYRYPEGVRGVWGITYNLTDGSIPVAGVEVGLYVNEIVPGERRDQTKSTADGMYYFVMGTNDVEYEDEVIGKIENNALTGNTRMPAEDGSIMGLDIWGTLERSIAHPYKEPPPVVIPSNVDELERAQEVVNRSLQSIMNGIGQSESSEGAWNSAADVQIQDETFTVPGTEWLDAQEVDLPVEGSITFYETPEVGREPIPVYTLSKVSSGSTFRRSGDMKSEMLAIAAEDMQSSEKATVPEGKDGKFTLSAAGKASVSEASANETVPASGEGVADNVASNGEAASENNKSAADEFAADKQSLTDEEQTQEDDPFADEATSEMEAEAIGIDGAEGEDSSSNDVQMSENETSEEDAAANASDQSGIREQDFLGFERAENLLTDVRVVEGAVYVIDGASEMSLLEQGESMRVFFKKHELQPVPAVKTDPPSAMAVKADPPPVMVVKADPVKPLVKDDVTAMSVKDDKSVMKVDPAAKNQPESFLMAGQKTDSVAKVISAEPKEVVARASTPVKVLAKAGVRYGVLKNLSGKDVFLKCRGGEWQAAKEGMTLLPGDEIRTASNSSVDVLLDGNKVGRVEIKEGSLFRIGKAETDVLTGDKTTLLELAIGKVMVHAEKLQGKSKFEVKTPTVLTGVRGTIFEVTVKEKRRSV
jgi:hypothetical protein